MIRAIARPGSLLAIASVSGASAPAIVARGFGAAAHLQGWLHDKATALGAVASTPVDVLARELRGTDDTLARTDARGLAASLLPKLPTARAEAAALGASIVVDGCGARGHSVEVFPSGDVSIGFGTKVGQGTAKVATRAAFWRAAGSAAVEPRLEPTVELKSTLWEARHRAVADREIAALTALAGQPCVVELLASSTREGPPGVEEQTLIQPRYRAALGAASQTGLLRAPAARLQVKVDCARGLESVHDIGLLHLDVKAANILVRPQGQETRAAIAAFGWSAPVDGEKPFGGTAASCSPDLCRRLLALDDIGALARGTPDDVYALGLVFYELIHGAPPRFVPPRGGSDAAFFVHMAALTQADVDAACRPAHPGMHTLDGVVHAMLAVDPAARPPIGDVVEALEALQ